MKGKDHIKKFIVVVTFLVFFGALVAPFALTFAAHSPDFACNVDPDCKSIQDTKGWKGARCVGGSGVENTILKDMVGHCRETPAPSQQLPEGPEKAQDLLDTLDLITDWIFAIAMTIGLIFLIMAAFQFVTGGGDPTKMSEARQKLLYAFIGIAVAFVSAGFVRVIGEIVR